MTEPKKKRLEDIDREVTQCKQQLNINESFILSMITQSKSQSPERHLSRSQTDRPFQADTNQNMGCFGGTNSKTPLKTSASPEKRVTGGLQGQDVLKYLSSMKKLQGNLEEKSYIMQVDFEKQRLQYQNQIKQLTKEVQVLSYDLEVKTRESAEKEQRIKGMMKQLEDLAHYRRENVELKGQNKKYKVDNKVLMNHIDRLTKVTQSAEEKKRLVEERQMRVMKSLYQDTLPNIEQRENEKDTISNLTNKIALDDATDRNGQLKSLIRRLNQEIQFLKKQKELLLEENKQKTSNFENQKRLADMSEESNQKLKDVITKMGEKIMSLEQINQTLRQSLLKYQAGDEVEDDLYYLKQTKAKAGQFYYKKK